MEEQKVTKFLGGHVNEEIYWAFRKKASERKETMLEAIENAALLYIDCSEDEGSDK